MRRVFRIRHIRIRENRVRLYRIRETRTRWKAKGLLAIMLSLPDDWNYSTRGLAAICKEGVEAIGNTIKELEKAGYIVRRQLRGANVVDGQRMLVALAEHLKQILGQFLQVEAHGGVPGVALLDLPVLGDKFAVPKVHKGGIFHVYREFSGVRH
mgnify:CR=1 FL=1